MMRKRKRLTASEIQVNQQFVSYTVGKSTRMPWMDYIKEIKDDCIVIYDKTRPNLGSEEIPKTAIFEVELSDEEYNAQYYYAAKEVFDILSGSEYLGDHGYHEMWNAWIGRSCQEMYNNLREEKLTLIGWFRLSEIKHGWFSDCDIGIIAEDENGDRFWCHWEKTAIDEMCECYKEQKTIKMEVH